MRLFRKRGQESDKDLERFSMPAKNIFPLPVPRVVFLLFALVLGLAFVGVGIGTELALHRVDSVTNASDQKSQQRDDEHRQTEEKLAAQQKQITALQTQLDDRFTKDHQAVCTALRAVFAGDPHPDPILVQLGVNYGC